MTQSDAPEQEKSLHDQLSDKSRDELIHMISQYRQKIERLEYENERMTEALLEV